MKETKFKQTEVGMIPWDWDIYRLGDFINKMEAGVSVNSDESLCSKSYVLKTSAVHNGVVNYREVKPVVKRDKHRLKCPLKSDCLIVSRMNTPELVGECAYSEKDVDNVYLPDRLWLVPNNSKKSISFKLLNYILGTPIMRDAVKGSATGTSNSMKNISKDKFLDVVCALPPTIEEQQRIANALSDVDTLIINLEKLIAKKKNIKQGAMQQLLTGRKRLPGFGPSCRPERSTKCAVEGSSHFKMTELGPIPSDWEFIPVSELAKDMADGPFGSNLKKEHYTSDPETRIIQLSNIGEEGWIDENIKYTTFEHAKTIARCIVPNEESILVAKMMPAGRAIICPNVERQYVLGSDVIRITANEKLYSKYFVYASKSNVYLKQISDNTQGSTRQRTSISKLRKIQILLPSSVKEQTAIANVLSDMDSEIQTLETKLAKYRKLKTGMMQQLLTGKIRLF